MPLSHPGRRRRIRFGLILALAIGLLVLGFQPVAGATQPVSCQSGPSASFDPSAARQALARLIGPAAHQFELRPAARAGTGDCFTVTGRPGHIVVTGTSNATLLTGANYYLKYVVHDGITWDGDATNHLPRILPAPGTPLSVTTPFANRLANNDTMPGYTGPYWTFSQWQHEIDVLAANGINEMMDYPGAAILYDLVFQQFGYTDAQLRSWIPQPGHQPWWLMQNMSTFDEPISSQLLAAQAILGRQIADQLRALNMVPVLPGYFGTVPPGFTQHDPGADVVPQGVWAGFPRPDWLSPLDPAFTKIAAAYYRDQQRIFGPSTMFEMNPLQEGGLTGDIPLGPAAKAIQDALLAANPKAIWTMLGWQANPQPAVLAAIDTSKILILDGTSDTSTTIDRDTDWGGAPYVFGSIWNYGGHSSIGANMTDWTSQFPVWANRPGSALTGIAMMPEANDSNPVAMALFTELAWHPTGIDPNSWITDYASWRYGGTDPHAEAAWQDLLASAYSTPANGTGAQNENPFGLQPDLSLGTAQRYDTSTFALALPQLLAVSPSLRDSSAYSYDLVDVARQVLDNDSMLLLPEINTAYQDKDRSLFDSLSQRWLNLMSLQDKLLGTNSNFLIGPWIQQARNAASSPAEAARLEYDARTMVTEWGTGTAEPILHDYADRDRQGLMEFYRDRWQTYFASLDTALQTGKPPVAINWAAIDDAWCHQQNNYPTTPTGSAYQLATQVWQTVATDPAFAKVTASTDPTTVVAGQSSTATVTVANTNPVDAATGVALKLTAPSGFTVTATSPTTFATVAVGQQASATYTVTVPAGYQPTSAIDQLPLTATATFDYGGRPGANSAQAPLLAVTPVSSTYQTAAFTSAAFGQLGSSLAIYAGGADMWAGTNQFGTIYSSGALATGDTVTTEVTAQADTGPWARAGIVVRNSLAANGSNGYLDLAVTPANGCALSSDTNGDGLLDTVVNGGGFTAPTYLKLVRTATSYTGYCSTDGATWQTVGTATVPSAAAAQDVGVFATAANGGSGAQGLADFTGFTVTGPEPAAGA
ncbi:MAG TPA: alpha-N-acetylglucosaminidase TIM-barrel domain-containing protein [Pseudonocardiaceae bacterium]|jgi:alpha-N-acetylglucosaminidase|nr:alpha-N-acetylglucosaminidase TIM-barrel domain-containing protein [Pseudonocardiaceae bacterium]